MTPKVFSILNKLYISFAAIVLMILAIIGYKGVRNEFMVREAFNRAHENLEKIGKYNPIRGKLNLLESRELTGLESSRRRFPEEGAAKPNIIFEEDELIDSTCFNESGYVRKPSSSYCSYPIYSFSRGEPYIAIGFYLGYMAVAALVMFLIRKWAIWLVK